MSTVSGRSAPSHAFRRYVARSVIVVYFFLLLSVGLAVIGRERYAFANIRQWITMLAAFVPLTAGFAIAVKVLGAADRGRSKRRTVWAAVLMLVGVVALAVEMVFGL